MAGDREFVPVRSSELTPEWCTSAMHDAGVLPGSVSVESVQVVPLGGGTGLAGETVRVQFGYPEGSVGLDAALPRTAVAKFANEQPVIKGLLESIDAYGREISFYQSLSKSMPMRVPRFLGGAMDPGRGERGTRIVNKLVNGLPAKVQLAMTVDPTKLLRPSKRRYALLIEDLGDGLVVHDVVQPPPPDQLRVPLAELAKLHAAFWGRDELAGNGCAGQLVTSTPRLYQNVYDGRVRDLMGEVWDWFTDEHLALTDEATRRLAEDVETINRGVTLVHGDPRTDNLLFSPDGQAVTFVDWSLPAYAHPAYDVGYLLSAGLLVEDGGRVPELGRFYLDELAARGRQIEPAEFWRMVKASVRAMLAQQVQAIPHPLSGYGDKNLEDYWVPRMLSTLQNVPA